MKLVEVFVVGVVCLFVWIGELVIKSCGIC